MNQITSADIMIATLTHIGGIFFGFLPSLIVWIVHKDSNPYVTAHSREALNFQLTMLIAMFVSALLVLIGIGILLLGLVHIVNVVICIIAAIKTAGNEPFHYPFTLQFLK